jgi:predicted  nucleic acid-binding Zn-ribbon protein
MNRIDELQFQIEQTRLEIDEINNRLREAEEHQVLDLENELDIAQINLESLQDELTYLVNHNE